MSTLMRDEFEESGYKQSGRGRLRGLAALEDFLHHRSVLIEQPVVLSGHLLFAERFTKRMVETAKTVERLIIAEQVHDPRMLL